MFVDSYRKTIAAFSDKHSRFVNGFKSNLKWSTEFTWEASSASASYKCYCMDAEVGWCSCRRGNHGRSCKTQVWLHNTFSWKLPILPAIGDTGKLEPARLTFGSSDHQLLKLEVG